MPMASKINPTIPNAIKNETTPIIAKIILSMVELPDIDTSSPVKSIICFPVYFPFVYLRFYLAFREELIVLQHFQVLIQPLIEILREELHHL